MISPCFVTCVGRHWCFVLFIALLPGSVAAAERLVPVHTTPLTITEDPASLLIDSVDRFLLLQIAQTTVVRQQRWKQAMADSSQSSGFIAAKRKQLAEILGIRQSRFHCDALELVGTTDSPAQIGQAESIRVIRVRWPVLADPDPNRQHLASVFGEGLLLEPAGPATGTIIAIPDADQTPEQLCGLQDGIPVNSQYPVRLAAAGFRVIIPVLISRREEARLGRAIMTDREFIYRSSFVLGQHLIGYELQKVLALVDLAKRPSSADSGQVGVIGYGEGAMLAMFAAALAMLV